MAEATQGVRERWVGSERSAQLLTAVAKLPNMCKRHTFLAGEREIGRER